MYVLLKQKAKGANLFFRGSLISCRRIQLQNIWVSFIQDYTQFITQICQRWSYHSWLAHRLVPSMYSRLPVRFKDSLCISLNSISVQDFERDNSHLPNLWNENSGRTSYESTARVILLCAPENWVWSSRSRYRGYHIYMDDVSYHLFFHLIYRRMWSTINIENSGGQSLWYFDFQNVVHNWGTDPERSSTSSLTLCPRPLPFPIQAEQSPNLSIPQYN